MSFSGSGIYVAFSDAAGTVHIQDTYNLDKVRLRLSSMC